MLPPLPVHLPVAPDPTSQIPQSVFQIVGPLSDYINTITIQSRHRTAVGYRGSYGCCGHRVETLLEGDKKSPRGQMEALTQERAHGWNGYPGSGAGPGNDEEGSLPELETH